MKSSSNKDLRKAMNECVLQINCIMKELDAADRLAFMNELIIRIMPDRKKAKVAGDSIEKRHRQPLQKLSGAEMKIIRKLSDDTDRLFDLDGDNRA